jgi:intracellular sulfur oxidation DsrE/DsrF family protein
MFQTCKWPPDDRETEQLREATMSMFQHVARAATIGAIAVLVTASLATAEEWGGYWVPTTTNPATSWVPSTTSPTMQQPRLETSFTKRVAAKHIRKRSPLAAMARSIPDGKAHHLILQVNTNDPASMNLALNNATNVTQHFKELGEKVKIELVAFGPGLHMLREDTSPVKARIEEMALSTPEVSFKACGNTQEKMHMAENKEIPIIPQAKVVESGVARVMELQERGWSYVKP